MADVIGLRARFAGLHAAGTFLMPNAWDVGSARLFQSLGFDAVATTSSGLAATLGRRDQSVGLDELARHVAALSSALEIPLSVDAEDGYAEDVGGLESTVEVLADSGASGISIEDYRPASGVLDVATATTRVAAYVETASRHGLIVTARAENHLYGIDDLDDTIERLRAYANAGADVVYAPGLKSSADLASVVAAVPVPVNALLIPGGPTVAEMREIGVRRLSTGGSLAWVALGAAHRAARELLESGTQDYSAGMLSADDRSRAFQ
ncbi:MAG TPA: isocitrate lyase/phosphoenolpyruvate mutase family protein [Acidimicrobiia bacterium]|nr:isocitrate lyase/phosphoenolpyruvate mutase family protein [Acidimicrobiia bacterium]